MKNQFKKITFFILIFFTITQLTMAQTNYNAAWKSVATLEAEGKTKDAKKTVEDIIVQSRNEKNATQTVKALLYKYKYTMTLEEDAELKIVDDLKSEIQQSTGTDKAILQSILAELYWQYFQNNIWKFSNRTETEVKQSDDFRTWDLKTLFKEINACYLASLDNKNLLQQTLLTDYIPLLTEQKGSKVFRPTLYDLLANRAIEYFNDDKRNLAEPGNAFSIDDKKYFETAGNFIQLNISTTDTTSQDYNVLKIYQDLLRFRLKDNTNKEALADADLKRIEFVKEHYYNKDENEDLYFSALQRLKNEYAKCNTGATINFKIASFISEKAQQKNSINSYKLEDAIAICDETIKNFPTTEGATNCAILKESIFNKDLSITTEETVVPNEAFKALVNFKNVSKVYLKIIPINYDKKDKLFTLKNKETQEDIIKRLNAIKPIKSWSQVLPTANDYLSHSTEIKIDGIKQGFYAIIVSTNPTFSIATGKEAVAVTTLFSSQISYVVKNNSNDENIELYVLNRNTGQPLKKATVAFYRNTYDYSTRKYVQKELGTANTDETGFVSKKIAESKKQYYDNQDFQFNICYNNDFLPSEQSYYKYYYPRKDEVTPQTQVHLFTDRSIYRPGQTIYFKGIITQRTGEEYKIQTNYTIKVVFKDVNYQEIASQQFTTNEFGSFTGSFTAPTTGLLGNMTLATNFSAVDVQVEEYKRPNFEVNFDPIKKSYNLNDTIQVVGKAVSYAGANIDHASVKYSVRRVAQFPAWCWWGWRRPWFPATNEKIISNGTTQTDDNGNFTINFAAIPDLTISKTFYPYFNYEVTADVIDINGETHTTTTTVRVGYLAIEANMIVNNTIDYQKENKISVTTNNLNGEPEPTDVSVKLYSLIAPAYPKKARLWAEPDKMSWSKAEHDKVFPYEIYNNEDLMSNWQKGKLMADYSFNTAKQNEILIAPNSFPSGAYIAEFSCKDKNGNVIEFKKTFTSNSTKDKILNPKSFLYFNTDESSVEPNDTLHYQIGTSMHNAYAIVILAFKGNVIERKIIQLNDEIKSFSFPIKDTYKGGIDINYVLVNKNRNYSGNKYISVPYENKNLSVEWITFRDKLIPGAKEQWKLKISGTNKEKVTAELLATMYDASLDAFLPHSISLYLAQSNFNGYLGYYTTNCFAANTSNLYTSKNWNSNKDYAFHSYDALNLFGLNIGGYRYYYRNVESLKATSVMYDKKMLAGSEMVAAPSPGNTNTDEISAKEINPIESQDTVKPKKKEEIVPRTNLNETAFFFPQLQTDTAGNIILNFQMPEALTKWNFLGLAHTKDLHYQYFTKSVVTQKELMVTPNAPRFLREGDVIEFSTKITNLSDRDLNGKANLVLYDAATMKEITPQLIEATAGKKDTLGERNFWVEKGKNTSVSWTLRVPSGIDAITYKVIAQAENFSDGEQASLIVLPNRMMVTETMPLWVRGESKKSFTFSKLLNNKSTTLKNYNFTLEMSSQPVWYAVQALPYMMEYPYECAEQLFSRYYANSLATSIANSTPALKSVFEKWKNTDALLSNLEKNQELKSVLLEETPWVRDAQDETEQKKRIALLFDLSKMSDEQQKAFDKLIQMQMPNGGFAWFPGMPDNRYITQYIVAGFGHLAKLNVIDIKNKSKIDEVLKNAVAYLDDRLTEDLTNIKKYDKNYLDNNHLYYTIIHALYARSFFDYKIEKKNQEAYDYFINQEKKFWLEQDLYSKGMMALTLQRKNDKSTANKIITALKQNAINSEELGMYWKANESGGWYWYQAPVETQALLIEAFTEVANDTKSVDEMKVWLLKQKQTTAWKSTKATAEACYALLLQGNDWLKSDKLVEVKMNNQIVDPIKLNGTIEPGTGYYKVKWTGDAIKPEMAKIELKKTDKGPAYGAVYWQYFEDLDKITGANTSLQLTKKLFKVVATNEGKKLVEITDKTPLQIGDEVKVRIELRTDRNLEYVHLKDMRAAGFEPINVLSQYKYQDGLGYYESTKDVATHFFMDWMNKGIYVFEYSMRATIAGNFSNGITLIESMYAPEFKAHSNGERVNIVKNN